MHGENPRSIIAMGTNYFARQFDLQTCRVKELHIGKSSNHRDFYRCEVPGENLHTLEAWQRLLADSEWRIFDEYDTEITCHEFIAILTRQALHPETGLDFV